VNKEVKRMIILAIFLVISNLPPLKSLLEVFLSKPYYYTTKTHKFNGYEYNSKGAVYDEVANGFDEYKEACKQPEIILYRTFTAKPYKFWLWGEYLFHPKYRLLYLPMPDDYDYDLLNRRCE
jgi:hypothetical protein